MRHRYMFVLTAAAGLALAGCGGPDGEAEVDRALEELNVTDESGLSDVMIQAADPDEAVDYFTRSLTNDPDRVDLKRGLAQSLIRAGRNTEAVAAWQQVVAHPEATDEDRVELADALIRNNEWDAAEAILNAIPPTHETLSLIREPISTFPTSIRKLL